MTTRKPRGFVPDPESKLTGDDQWKAQRGQDHDVVDGVPIRPLEPGERLELMHPVKVYAPEPEVRFEVVGAPDPVERVGPDPDHHDWWTVAGREYRTPLKGRAEYPTVRLERDEVVILVTYDGNNGTRLEYLVATPDDREAHLAAIARAQHVVDHPEDGPFALELDVPYGFPRVDLDGLLDNWRGRWLRPVLVGDRVALARLARGNVGWLAVRVLDVDRELLRTWHELIAAGLTGRRVECVFEGCSRQARAMAIPSLPVCLGHLETPLGEEPEPARRGGIRAAAAAIASAVAG